MTWGMIAAGILGFGLMLFLARLLIQSLAITQAPPAHAPVVVHAAAPAAVAPVVAPVVVAPAPGAAAPAVVIMTTASLWRKLWRVGRWLLLVALVVAVGALVLIAYNNADSLPPLTGSEWDLAQQWKDFSLTQLIPSDSLRWWLMAVTIGTAVVLLVWGWHWLGWIKGLWILGYIALILLAGALVLNFLPQLAEWIKEPKMPVWYHNMSTEGIWGAAIVLMGIILIAHWVLSRNHSDPLVVTVRAIAVVLLLIVAGPSLLRWSNNNTGVCLGTEETCRQAQARRAADEAQLAYARQLAVERANRDAQRMVSLGCPGNVQVLDLRPDITSHFNLNKCAVQTEVLSGKVIFVDWTGLRTSQPLGPHDAGTIDFVIAGAYAAPGYEAKIKYSLCNSASKVPLTYECLPRNS